MRVDVDFVNRRSDNNKWRQAVVVQVRQPAFREFLRAISAGSIRGKAWHTTIFVAALACMHTIGMIIDLVDWVRQRGEA